MVHVLHHASTLLTPDKACRAHSQAARLGRACLVVCAGQQVGDGVLLHFARAGVLGQLGSSGRGRGSSQVQELYFMRGDVSMHAITAVAALPLDCQLGPAAPTQ